MRVTEGLTRISPGQIPYQFRVEDPSTFLELASDGEPPASSTDVEVRR
jgi:hypothetical protein